MLRDKYLDSYMRIYGEISYSTFIYKRFLNTFSDVGITGKSNQIPR